MGIVYVWDSENLNADGKACRGRVGIKEENLIKNECVEIGSRVNFRNSYVIILRVQVSLLVIFLWPTKTPTTFNKYLNIAIHISYYYYFFNKKKKN